MDASLLESARAAEESLRRREIEGVVEGVPEDHPLKDAMRKNRLRAQDLEGLPEGHPLLAALAAAKERHDLGEAMGREQVRTSEVHKARKIERREARERERATEREGRRTAADAAEVVNRSLDRVTEAVKVLVGALEEGAGPLSAMPESRVKIRRLERLANAALSAFASSRVRVRRT